MRDDSRYKIVRFNPLPFYSLWRGRGLWPLPLLSMYCIPLQIIMWLWFNTSHEKLHIFICFLEEHFFLRIFTEYTCGFPTIDFFEDILSIKLYMNVPHITRPGWFCMLQSDLKQEYLIYWPCLVFICNPQTGRTHTKYKQMSNLPHGHEKERWRERDGQGYLWKFYYEKDNKCLV